MKHLDKFTFYILHFTFAFAAMSAFAYDDVQVTYRGRLKENGVAPSAQTVSMTFRLYKDKKSKDPSWTMVKDDVKVGAGGLFQVALRGSGLADAIDDGLANWIGVTVGDGKEQYPRQALLASPGAEKAAHADNLAPSPKIGTANVKSMEAGALSVRSLEVKGEVNLPTSATTAAMDVNMTGAWHTIPVKGKVRFFNAAPPRDLGLQPAASGGCIFGNADCNCVALFTSESSDVMPGLSHFVKKGDQIKLPAEVGLQGGTIVRCRIYPIGVE